MTLFAERDEAAGAQGWSELGPPQAGTTTLDRVHQAMLLAGAGRGEALKRFLVEEGVGRQAMIAPCDRPDCQPERGHDVIPGFENRIPP